MYRSDRSNTRGGGVAAVVKKQHSSKINIIRTEADKGFEFLALDYHINNRNVIRFIVVYLPPVSSENCEITGSLVKILSDLIISTPNNSTFHITGDFNFSDTVWNGSYPTFSNKTSAIFNNFLNKFDLYQLIKSPTHTHGKTLDLFITPSPPDIIKLEVNEPFSQKCDHNMIEVELNVPYNNSSSKSSFHNFYQANYTEINNFLSSQSWDTILSVDDDIDLLYSKFINTLKESVENFVPVNNPKKNIRLPFKIKRIIREKKITYKKMKTNPLLKEKYKSLCKEYKNAITLYYKRIEYKIMNSKHKKPFYSYVKKKMRARSDLPPLITSQNQLLLDPKDKSNALNLHFSSVFLQQNNNPLPDLPPHTNSFDKMKNFEITDNDILLSISKLKNSVSRSPEDIPAYYIVKTSKNLLKPLSFIFNLCLKHGKLPSIWKSALVVPIFKKGKKSDPANYRPVSLTSVFCRIFERIIHYMICQHLADYNLISRVQHGFISGRSTLTQHFCYFDQLTKLQSEKSTFNAIYIDFSKAFDKLSHAKLMHVLHHYQLNANVIAWIKEWLSGRIQQTVVEDQFSDVCGVTSGVPQGSVLGPLLFLLYLESLITHLKEACKSTTVFAYADDVKLLSKDPNDLQNALSIIGDWADRWDLVIHPTKSIHLYFRPKNDPNLPPIFFLNHEPISQDSQVNDLGITLADNFKWTSYIHKITSKANRIAYTIIRSFKSNDHKMLMNLFKTYVRPILEYNTAIWNPHLLGDIANVERVQRRFTKMVCQKQNISFEGYLDRLRLLQLDTLEIRRVKSDLILMFKIHNNHIDMDPDDFFTAKDSSYNLRSYNSHQLVLHKYSGSAVRHNFFTNRVTPTWNQLPNTLINSPDLATFKTRISQFDIRKLKIKLHTK